MTLRSGSGHAGEDTAGDLQAAYHGYSACVAGLIEAGHIADVLVCSITLGDLLITQGRLGDAWRPMSAR